MELSITVKQLIIKVKQVYWYLPVKICLERIFPMLVIGGSLIIDDYYDWGGCQKATDEYLKKVEGHYNLNKTSGVLTITKINNFLF
jgi:asparagine synthase (glutamine-hydrolysing)